MYYRAHKNGRLDLEHVTLIEAHGPVKITKIEHPVMFLAAVAYVDVQLHSTCYYFSSGGKF